MSSIDGTGATLAWPLVRSAAALLTEVAEGEDPGPSRPSGMPSEPAELSSTPDVAAASDFGSTLGAGAGSTER
jgi:nicotinate-nucleotide--dimethylbenzimidazole phosphoribosyltransferase